MLAASPPSASRQEEKQSLQEEASSEGRSTISTLSQDEQQTDPTNIFQIQKKEREVKVSDQEEGDCAQTTHCITPGSMV